MNQISLFSMHDKTPREKNLIATLILAAGLIAGSLAVDVAQLFTGSGFSNHAIREHTILEAGGKTWAAYTDPKVTLRVLSDENCEECNPDEALVWLRRIVPTIEATRIEANTAEGQKLVVDYELRTLPAFIFDRSVEETEFFTEAGPLFGEKNGQYVFDMNQIGLPVGKYLVAPAVDENDIVIGKRDAPVKLVVFSDFECQFCKLYHAEYKKLLALFGDNLALVYRHFPLPSHPQGEVAAEAAECADEQGKFMEYADILFDKQLEWGKTEGKQAFKNYAWRVKGLQGTDFARCLDSGKYAEKVMADLETAQDFNLSAAPATFIGTEFISGAAQATDLEPLVNTALGK